MTCWKNTAAATDQPTLQVNNTVFTPQTATEAEQQAGAGVLRQWRVERRYEVMVSGRGVDHPYIDWRSEPQEVPFEELIFCDGVCIGIYHAECVLLFDDPSTHEQEHFLGEFVTGPDRSRYVYDYYCLYKNEP